MDYREFGRAIVRLSAIGMGTYNDPSWIAGSRRFRPEPRREDKIAALRAGIELGINPIDTAARHMRLRRSLRRQPKVTLGTRFSSRARSGAVISSMIKFWEPRGEA